MFNIFKNTKIIQNHPLVSQLRDVRSLGLIVFACIVLLVSWSGAKAIQSNYKLEQQIAHLRQANELRQLENNNQKLKNQYYNTPQYLELASRQNFGLATPGEKELIVPKKIAMAHVSGLAAVTNDTVTETSEARKHLPLYQRNMQAWMNFFLHRPGGGV